MKERDNREARLLFILKILGPIVISAAIDKKDRVRVAVLETK